MDIKMVQWFDDHFYKFTGNDGTVKYFPSVTTKLNAAPKPFLAKWRGDIGNREADLRVFEACEKGKRIHFCCQLYLRGGFVLYNPYAMPKYSPLEIEEYKDRGDVFVLQEQDEMWQVAKFQKWIETVNPEVLTIESMVYSEIYQEAGTLDLLLNIKEGMYMVNGAKPLFIPGGNYVADIKSGGFYEESHCQVAAYAAMVNENPVGANGTAIEPVIGTIVLHLNSTTKNGISGMSTHLRTGIEVIEDYKTYRHIAQVWEDQNKDAMPKLFEFPTIITKNKELA